MSFEFDRNELHLPDENNFFDPAALDNWLDDGLKIAENLDL